MTMRFFVLLLVFVSVVHLNAQPWQGTNPIYFNGGYVGIGTSAPPSILSIKGDYGLNIEPLNGSPVHFYITSNSGDNIIGVNARTRYGAWDIPDNTKPSSFLTFSTYNINNPYYGGMAFFTRAAGGGGLGSEKMVILNNGNVGIATTNPGSQFQINSEAQRTSLGNIPQPYRQALGWATQYMGFNLSRESQGWTTYSDGVNNGAAMLFADPFGQIKFINVASTGNTTRYLTEQEINDNTKFIIAPSGNVGIGTTSMDAKLTVKGTVHANEIKVDLNGAIAPDYVFEPTYTLPSLDSVQRYINQNKHLPEVPSAKEMEANGVHLGEMNMLLLKKVEELTLYLITQQEQLRVQQQEINKLKSKVK